LDWIYANAKVDHFLIYTMLCTYYC